MKITYIHHSCFSVELESVVLIFDYFKGIIPVFDKNKQILVFASHNHYDHYSDNIFHLSNLYPQVAYILSKDITPAKEKLKENILFLEANTAQTLPSVYNIPIKIETLKSTDQGIAFLVTAENKIIYHGGDLHWWAWEDDTKEVALAMENAYKDEIKRLQNIAIDVAFLPLDGRLDKNYWLGFDYFMKLTDTKIAFPMHLWEQYSLINKFKQSNEAISYTHKVMDITKENQIFII